MKGVRGLSPTTLQCHCPLLNFQVISACPARRDRFNFSQEQHAVAKSPAAPALRPGTDVNPCCCMTQPLQLRARQISMNVVDNLRNSMSSCLLDVVQYNDSASCRFPSSWVRCVRRLHLPKMPKCFHPCSTPSMQVCQMLPSPE